VKLVWTKSNKILSIFIRTICNEDCSHFSFVFESAANGLMFESNLIGTHPAFYKSSLKSHTIVHELNIPLTIEEEDKIWDIVTQKYDGKPYDFLGAIYLGWYKFLNSFFGVKIPDENKWSQPDQYFCNEVYDVLNNIPNFKKIDVKNGMHSPHDVWMELKKENLCQ